MRRILIIGTALAALASAEHAHAKPPGLATLDAIIATTAECIIINDADMSECKGHAGAAGTWCAMVLKDEGVSYAAGLELCSRYFETELLRRIRTYNVY